MKILPSSDKTPAVASLRKAIPIISTFVTTKVGFIRFGTLEPTGNVSYWRRKDGRVRFSGLKSQRSWSSARFSGSPPDCKGENCSPAFGMQSEPHHPLKTGKGQTSISKATRPHTVTLGWHLSWVHCCSMRALHLAVFGWSALFFCVLEMQPRTSGPDERDVRVSSLMSP